MKNYLYKILIALVLLTQNLHIFAYDFEVDGIYYNKLSDNQVEVTYYGSTNRGYSGTVIIPMKVTYNSIDFNVVSIGAYTFFECSNLTSVTIPNSITKIGNSALGRTGVTTITIPNSVTSIGDDLFYDCDELKSIRLSNSIDRLGRSMFCGCEKLTNITIPPSVEQIGEQCFSGCKELSSLLIPNSVKSIGSSAFQGCTSLESIQIPNSVTSLGTRNTFFSCTSLKDVFLPSTITVIPELAFASCSSLEKIIIPNSVTTIGSRAFAFCEMLSLVSFNLSSNLTSIGEKAFQECKNIEIITIPEKVTSIAKHAFGWCSKLSYVKIEANTPPYLSTGVFLETPPKTLEVPSGTKNAYEADTSWKYWFDNIVESTVDYNLSITALGSGSITYDGITVRNKTTSFTISEGTSVIVTILPDIGYHIASVKMNNTDVTSSVSSNKYTISDIKANTTLEVVFEAIPPTTYTLSITASGYGSATYNSTSARNNTKTFTVNEGSSATITFSPDNGYRIKSVMLNNTDVTASVSNNQYTISNISRNTTVEVEFETIPVKTYTLSVTSSGNGSAYYNNTTVRNKTEVFSVNEGTSATITFSPDNGYRIKNVKVGSTDVTSSVSSNKYTISDIKANTTLEVVFEAIPPTTYILSITASGYGSATYNSISARNNTKTFTVNEGTSATITFSPDNGYRIKNVKVGSTDVTSSVSSNKYTISDIKANTTLEVVFEAIPPTTYTLSVTSSGNGSAYYNNTTVRNKTEEFTVNEGTTATISFTPDNGYRIKSVKVGSTDVTSSVSNNRYTISDIKANTTLEVVFEAIPPTTYTLSITASGYGSATYNSTSARNNTKTFTVNEGSSATITFSPDNGYRVKSVKVNNATVSISNNQYTISNISRNTTVEVEFEAIPPTTYTLSINSTGNGSVSYSGTSIRNQSKSFTVNEGTTINISLYPDNGYRLKSIKVNNTDVMAYVSNGTYTINSLNRNTTIDVEFVAIPSTTYTLSISASGSGSASFNNTTIRNQTKSFTVNEGSNATVTFSPDSGYCIASVKVNNTDVTSSVSNNRYTINNITANTALSVVFEAIPLTTYSLSITSIGNGSVTYDGTSIRSKTSSFTVKEGSSVSISLIPDNGYRIKSVKENGTNVISYVSSNKYVISSITRNTTVEVEFEAIPPTTYTLSITASGNGSATYGGTTIRSNTSSFTVNDGDYATVTFSPDSGYRIASVKVNDIDVTSSVSDNRYTISNITENTTLSVVFEAIPPTMYTLTITASGNGDVQYGSTTVRNQTSAIEAEEGSSATVTFSPDGGNRIAMVTVNGQDVTASIENYRYNIANISGDVTIVAAFEEIISAVAYDGVNYTVVSQDDGTVKVAAGNYGQVLTVPASFTAIDRTWQVTDIEADALKDNVWLAAIIWNPEVAFTATVSNPNLLLYVKSESYAPQAIHNVVVNGTAANITLVEAVDGNDFYCPQSFTAQKISYSHSYGMQTGIRESRGWETIALPFDVQTVTHSTKGTIVPFANWKNGDTSKPFWLYELTGTGFVEAGSIKAYTPYIISMPNNPQYDSQWLLSGVVTFAASNVTVGMTDNVQTSQYQERTFVPNFQNQEANQGLYALNVVNDYCANNSGMTEGSKFVLNMRRIHPFEAYMMTASNIRYAIGVFDDMTTGIRVMVDGSWMMGEAVYDLQGRKVENPSTKGVYIMNGKKKIIK